MVGIAEVGRLVVGPSVGCPDGESVGPSVGFSVGPCNPLRALVKDSIVSVASTLLEPGTAGRSISISPAVEVWYRC